MKIMPWMILTGALALTACSTPYNAVTKTAKVLWNPDVPVGYEEDLPSTADLAMLAEPNVNTNGSQQPTPINFQVLQLEDSSRVMAAGFDELLSGLEDALGSNYIDHKDYTLVPGQFKFIEPMELTEKTRYLGVVAYYAYPNQSQWKKVVKVEPQGGDYHLLVNLRDREVVLEKADDKSGGQ